MTYAQGTEVPVERSRAEIERLITRYGASSFASGFTHAEAVIMFEAHGRRVKFVLPMPKIEDFKKGGRLRYGSYVNRTPAQQKTAFEAEQRRLWRALTLVIKAKLEAVESKVTTFESEFLAHIVDPSTGRTIGELAVPALEAAYSGLPMPPLLGTGSDR